MNRGTRGYGDSPDNGLMEDRVDLARCNHIKRWVRANYVEEPIVVNVERLRLCFLLGDALREKDLFNGLRKCCVPSWG